MTHAEGQIVRLSQRDWVRIIAVLLSSLAVLVASWTSVRISMARLEVQMESLDARIDYIEEAVRAR